MAQVWLVDKYGAQVIQLHERDGYYALPESATTLLLDVGDEYRVECFDDGDDEWRGEGFYAIRWSDGGMDWTSDGPVYFGSKAELVSGLAAAWCCSTETHLPYAEFIGETLGDER